jgi:4-cresol dehydrogenase (hydroxylating)
MRQITSEDDPYWQTIYRLKTVFDPNDIIAPGRYNLSRRIGAKV